MSWLGRRSSNITACSVYEDSFIKLECRTCRLYTNKVSIKNNNMKKKPGECPLYLLDYHFAIALLAPPSKFRDKLTRLCYFIITPPPQISEHNMLSSSSFVIPLNEVIFDIENIFLCMPIYILLVRVTMGFRDGSFHL